MDTIDIKKALENLNITEDYVNKLAKEQGLIKRVRKITSINLLQAFCSTSVLKTQSFNQLAIDINKQTGKTISKQAVSDKVTESLNSFLISLLKKIIRNIYADNRNQSLKKTFQEY